MVRKEGEASRDNNIYYEAINYTTTASPREAATSLLTGYISYVSNKKKQKIHILVKSMP